MSQKIGHLTGNRALHPIKSSRFFYFLSLLTFSLLSLILLSLLSACQPKAEKARTIKIGFNWDLTGPVSEGGGAVLDTYRDYINYFEEKGGIKGAKIELLWGDSGYSVPRTLSNYTRFKEQGAVIIAVQASLEAYTLKPIAERDRIPIVSTAVDPANYYPPGWVFTATGPSSGEMFAVFLKWLKQNWKEQRAPRIAVIGWDNTLGRAPQAAKKFTQEIGAQIVSEEFVPVPTMDYSGQLLRARDARSDYIFIGIASGGLGPFLKDAERLGIRGKIPIILNGVVPVDHAVGPAGLLAEGLIGFTTRNPHTDANNPGIKEMQDYLTKVKGRAVDNDLVTWGWTDARALIEIVRLSVNEVGLDNLSGDNVKGAMEKIKNLDMNGLTKPLNFGPDKRRGNDFAKAVQVKGGKGFALTDWIEIPVVKVE